MQGCTLSLKVLIRGIQLNYSPIFLHKIKFLTKVVFFQASSRIRLLLKNWGPMGPYLFLPHIIVLAKEITTENSTNMVLHRLLMKV